MALTGLEIYKQLPKTNCKKCGFPTCLAFAMQLAQKKASLDKCPDVTEDGKVALEGASAPPMKLVAVGVGESKVEVGNETVLFRHEESFYHQPGIAVRLSDTLTEEQITKEIEAISKLSFERVGLTLKINMLALENSSGNVNPYVNMVKKVTSLTNLPLVLIASQASLTAVLEFCKQNKPLLYKADDSNYEQMAQIAKDSGCPLVVKGNGDLDALDQLVQKVTKAGVTDILLDPGSKDLSHTIQDLTKLRRLALKKNYRPLGFSTFVMPHNDDPYLELAEASMYITKYGGIIAIKGHEPWQALPLVTGRQDIYTDPRKPIQAEIKVYSFGNVDRNSPIMVTTNFSLTFFTVAGEVEASKMPAYMFLVNTDGTSVLTAWAADKFTSETITNTLNKLKVEEFVNHKTLVIPGLVSIISGRLQDDSGWKVVVGPKEAAGISTFLRTDAWKK